MTVEQVFQETQNVGVIYRFTSPSGKQYIGQAVDFQKRYSTYKRRKQNSIGKKFWNAILKYDGIENFEVEILCKVVRLECVSELKKLLDKLEIFFIKYYDTYNSGYNSTQGGEGSLGRITKEETKRKIGEANKGNNKREDITCTCDACGKEFKIQPHIYNAKVRRTLSGKIYCSSKCGGGKKKSTITYNCGWCNKEHTLPTWLFNKYTKDSKSGKLFCDARCARLFKIAVRE
jgi:group I intron endonuclease